MYPNNNNHYMNRNSFNPNYPSNSYNNQSFDPNKLNQNMPEAQQHQSSTLLPYHQYMAIQKRNSEQNLQSNTNQNNNFNNHYDANRNHQYNNYQKGHIQQGYYGVPQSFYSFPPVYQQTYTQPIQQNIPQFHMTNELSKQSIPIKNEIKKTQNTQNKYNSVEYQSKSIQKPPSRNNQYQSTNNYRNDSPYKKNQDYKRNIQSQSDAQGWSQQEQEQELLYQKYQEKKKNYQKNKPIKKGEHIVDDPEQIRKWIQARKKNYPGLRKRQIQQAKSKQQNNCMNQQEKKQMSKLQMKIRKKLVIINGDSRSILKKIRNIQLLKRIVQDPKILRKEKKTNIQTNKRQNKWNKQKEVKQKIIQESKKKEKKVVENNEEGQLSESQKSMQPEEVPLNKIPRNEFEGQLIQDLPKQQENQFVESSKLLDFVLKNEQPSKDKKNKKINNNDNVLENARVTDPQSIIAHLKQKQQEDKQSLDNLFDYKSNSHSYRYRVQTLQTNLKLDDIFAETTYLLQAIRYIVKQNFFQNKK